MPWPVGVMLGGVLQLAVQWLALKRLGLHAPDGLALVGHRSRPGPTPAPRTSSS